MSDMGRKWQLLRILDVPLLLESSSGLSIIWSRLISSHKGPYTRNPTCTNLIPRDSCDATIVVSERSPYLKTEKVDHEETRTARSDS